MTYSDIAPSPRRRPQWRGNRKAVLVRMPVDLAQRLSCEAEMRQRSVSEHASELLAAALEPDDAT
jgi:hypothetical protein